MGEMRKKSNSNSVYGDLKNVDAALEDSVGVAIKTEPDKAKVIKEIFRSEYLND